MVFFGFFVDFGLRTNLNVALVAMVNYTEKIPKILQNNSECTDEVFTQTKERTFHQVFKTIYSFHRIKRKYLIFLYLWNILCVYIVDVRRKKFALTGTKNVGTRWRSTQTLSNARRCEIRSENKRRYLRNELVWYNSEKCDIWYTLNAWTVRFGTEGFQIALIKILIYFKILNSTVLNWTVLIRGNKLTQLLIQFYLKYIQNMNSTFQKSTECTVVFTVLIFIYLGQ